MSLTILQTFQKDKSIWFGQERLGLPKQRPWVVRTKSQRLGYFLCS